MARRSTTEGPGNGLVERRSYRVHFVVLCLLNLLAVGWVLWDEAITRRPWKAVQGRFNDLLAEAGRPSRAPGIRQTTNPKLGLVDRCQTCHLGINSLKLNKKNIPREFRVHPQRAVLLGKGHEPERVGCVLCHHGQGPQTRGVSGAPFDHGHNDPHWPRPLLRGAFVESSCVGCHTEERAVPGADVYNRGRWLFEDRRCFGCHDSRRGTPDFAGGPSLDQLRRKTTMAFVQEWIADPARIRRHSRMPRFWPKGTKSSKIHNESNQIAAYLGSLRPSRALPRLLTSRSADGLAEGKRLFEQVGCRGCHRLDGAEAEIPQAERYGPSLERIGHKATAAWLTAWLDEPTKVRDGARMPNMRLSVEERDSLVDYLASIDGETATAGPAWPRQPAARVERGRALVSALGCAGCHALPGVGVAPPPGPTLRGFGDTGVERLEWGGKRRSIRCGKLGALACWTRVKIATPHRMAGGQLKLTMPDHRLSEDEATALAVFVLSDRGFSAPVAYRRRLSATQRASRTGERVLATHNCRSCHDLGRWQMPELDEEGQHIGTTSFFVGGEIRSHFSSLAEAPPSLSDAGSKFQYPWLAGYLEWPTILRPWLTARMPRFDRMTAVDRRGLVRYLALREQAPYPFQQVHAEALRPQDRADARWLFGEMQCTKCHKVSSVTGLELADLGPDLALSRQRLQPAWIERWLLRPQAMTPGTRMPSYFLLADDDDPHSFTTPYPDRLGGHVPRQVRALVRLNMQVGLDPSLGTSARGTKQKSTR